MTRDKSRESYEDQVIAVGDTIKREIFDRATHQWRVTPDNKKKRPWPFCKNIECNRSLICKENRGDPCEGFAF